MNDKEEKIFDLEYYLRCLINGEYTAIADYETAMDYTEDKQVLKTLKDIANEERVHVGELESLYANVFPEGQKFIDKGHTEFTENKIAKKLMKLAAYMDFDIYYNKKDNTFDCILDIGNFTPIYLLDRLTKSFSDLVNKEIDKLRKLDFFEDFSLSCDVKRIEIDHIGDKIILIYPIMSIKKDLKIAIIKDYGYNIK